MSSEAITTVLKMIESLPETAQNQVVEHLREYLEEMQDEMKWDILFHKTQPQLVAAAQRARQQINEGKSQPLEHDKL